MSWNTINLSDAHRIALRDNLRALQAQHGITATLSINAGAFLFITLQWNAATTDAFLARERAEAAFQLLQPLGYHPLLITEPSTQPPPPPEFDRDLHRYLHVHKTLCLLRQRQPFALFEVTDTQHRHHLSVLSDGGQPVDRASLLDIASRWRSTFRTPPGHGMRSTTC